MKWHDVTKKLPKRRSPMQHSGLVLISADYDGFEINVIGYLNHNGVWCSHDYTGYSTVIEEYPTMKVTHWAKLPKRPK